MAFLSTLKKALKEIRNTTGFAQGLTDYAQSQAFMTDFAYLDSTDISTVYTHQPPISTVMPAPAPSPAPVAYMPAGPAAAGAPASLGVPVGVPMPPPPVPAPGTGYDPAYGAYPNPLPPPGSANPEFIEEPLYAPAADPNQQMHQYG